MRPGCQKDDTDKQIYMEKETSMPFQIGIEDIYIKMNQAGGKDGMGIPVSTCLF